MQRQKQTQLVITVVKDLHTSKEPEAVQVILDPQDPVDPLE